MFRRYALTITFNTDADPKSEAFNEMLVAAFVQVEDAESVNTDGVVMTVEEA
jgi:hypothetical protein